MHNGNDVLPLRERSGQAFLTRSRTSRHITSVGMAPRSSPDKRRGSRVAQACAMRLPSLANRAPTTRVVESTISRCPSGFWCNKWSTDHSCADIIRNRDGSTVDAFTLRSSPSCTGAPRSSAMAAKYARQCPGTIAGGGSLQQQSLQLIHRGVTTQLATRQRGPTALAPIANEPAARHPTRSAHVEDRPSCSPGTPARRRVRIDDHCHAINVVRAARHERSRCERSRVRGVAGSPIQRTTR